MPLTFYPQSDDAQRGSFEDRIELMLEAAGRYKAVVLDVKTETAPAEEGVGSKRTVPREQGAAFNWDEIATLLREIRELPEGNKSDKLKKADLLTKLAEVYEVLRAAKMSKLEAVRLALINEANQLRGGASQTVT